MAGSINRITRKVQAYIYNANSIQAPGGDLIVQVNPDDNPDERSKITANVGAGSAGTVSIGVALSRNYIGWKDAWVDADERADDKVHAYIQGSKIKSANNVTVSSRDASDITSHVGVVSFGLAVTKKGTALDFSGAGVESTNRIGVEVCAYIMDTDLPEANVAIKASDKSTITSYGFAGAMAAGWTPVATGQAFGLSIGASVSKNIIRNDVKAYFSKSEIDSLQKVNNLSVITVNESNINTTSWAASVSLQVAESASAGAFSGGGAGAHNFRGRLYPNFRYG